MNGAFVSWFPQKRVNLFGFRSRYNGAGKSGEEKGKISHRNED